MRKQTKLVAVASAAALLAIGASMTSFAATGWVEEGGEWYYYEKDGSKAEDEWKKSGDKWFWLDSENDGAMAIDKLVEDGEHYYYVDSTGAMVSNTWVKVVNEEQDDDTDPAEYNYYYMQSNGKAYKGGDKTSFKTIDGKRYAFDSEGKMLYGWVNGDSSRIDDESGWEDEAKDVWYCGSWDDGAMKTGWQKINVYIDEDDDTTDHWFFFNSNGRRFYNDKDGELKTKTVNGKKYGFDARGVMVYEWNVATGTDTSSPNNWSYFRSPEDGARVTKGWFKVIPPSDDTTFTAGYDDDDSFDKDGATNEDENWYYADGDGKLYQSAIKSIKGKYYAFSGKGKMLSGLVLLEVDNKGNIDKVWDDGIDADELSDLMDDEYEVDGVNPVDEGATLYYFGNDADSDGAMKTGSTTVTLDGDSYSFLFKSTGAVGSKGRGVTGVDDKKYIYKLGMKIKAGSDDKYQLVTAVGNGDDLAKNDINSPDGVTVTKFSSSDAMDINSGSFANSKDETVNYAKLNDEGFYLVNTSGAIQKDKTAAKDGNDWYFFVDNREVKLYADSKTIKPAKGETTDLTDWEKWD